LVSRTEEAMMLEEADLMQALRRHWEYSGKDEDIAHEIYHDDAVLEFPQSGERFEGVENFREWRRRYPANLRFHTRRITHRADLVVVENLISYDGAPWMFTVSLLEFRDDRVAHERIYIMDAWDAAEWRTPWRSELPADPPPPSPSS
jgi:ketosteroid isomerase-like protein